MPIPSTLGFRFRDNIRAWDNTLSFFPNISLVLPIIKVKQLLPMLKHMYRYYISNMNVLHCDIFLLLAKYLIHIQKITT